MVGNKSFTANLLPPSPPPPFVDGEINTSPQGLTVAFDPDLCFIVNSARFATEAGIQKQNLL